MRPVSLQNGTGLRRAVFLPTASFCNQSLRKGSNRIVTVWTYPIPETEKEPSPINTPQEWVTPKPSKRPDIIPDLEKLETPLPNALPGDPELPEDEEWEEQKKKLPEPDKPPQEPGEEPEEEGENDEENENDEEEQEGIEKPSTDE